MWDMNTIIGTHDLVFVTLDTLRYDVAQEQWASGQTPHFARHLPPTGWEQRHTPGSFTFAAHAAFFAGFLPTPATPGRHPRPFAMRFHGSETTTPQTCVFDSADLVSGLAGRGYHTLCIGGVGFFNLQTPLGSCLPNLFAERIWRPEFGVTDPAAFCNQLDWLEERLVTIPREQRLFLFINVATLHQPNYFYLKGATSDSLASHAAALREVDCHWPRLTAMFARRGKTFFIVCSDHGTAYGENGFHGHRLADPVVWTVPYTEFVIPEAGDSTANL